MTACGRTSFSPDPRPSLRPWPGDAGLKAAFPEAELIGCDVNREGVDFCAEQFGAVPVYSDPDPTLIDLDGSFDLIWVGSLLTHLDADRLPGLPRPLPPHLAEGGLLLFSSHGRNAVDRWPPRRQAHRGDRQGLPAAGIRLQGPSRRRGLRNLGLHRGLGRRSARRVDRPDADRLRRAGPGGPPGPDLGPEDRRAPPPERAPAHLTSAAGEIGTAVSSIVTSPSSWPRTVGVSVFASTPRLKGTGKSALGRDRDDQPVVDGVRDDPVGTAAVDRDEPFRRAPEEHLQPLDALDLQTVHVGHAGRRRRGSGAARSERRARPRGSPPGAAPHSDRAPARARATRSSTRRRS